MPEIVVRHLRADDHPALQRIFERASLANAGDRDALLAHPEVLQLSDDHFSRGRSQVAMLSDGKVVGFASTNVSGVGSLELDDLFLDPDWQRCGAARRLLAQIVTEAVAERVLRIEVTANDDALGFYRD